MVITWHMRTNNNKISPHRECGQEKTLYRFQEGSGLRK